MIKFYGKRSPLPRITMTMKDGDPEIKIPFTLRRDDPVYSKLGFDWGADNGGAIEVARVILRRLLPNAALRTMDLDKMYRQFAQDVVVKLVGSEFSVDEDTIRDWLRKFAGE